MTFEELLDVLAEQFSCDVSELQRGTAFEDLGADEEDFTELAWQIGEAIGVEVSEASVAAAGTVGALWKHIRDWAQEAE